MLLGSVLYKPSSLGDADILNLEDESYAAVALGLHGLPVLKIAVGFISARAVPVVKLNASPALLFRIERPFPIENNDVLPMTRVIDGHVPVDQIPFLTIELSRRGRQIRHDKIAYPQIFFIRPDLSD